MADQLALEVDPACAVRVVERRGGEERTLRVGPLGEPEARALATLLLNRLEEQIGRASCRERVCLLV